MVDTYEFCIWLCGLFLKKKKCLRISFPQLLQRRFNSPQKKINVAEKIVCDWGQTRNDDALLFVKYWTMYLCV